MKSPCRCLEPDRRVWRVIQHQSNRSHFSRGGRAKSVYSQLRCLQCGDFWRTKAAYVDEIAHAEGDEGWRLSPNSRDLEGNPGPEPTPKTRQEQRDEHERARNQAYRDSRGR